PRILHFRHSSHFDMRIRIYWRLFFENYRFNTLGDFSPSLNQSDNLSIMRMVVRWLLNMILFTVTAAAFADEVPVSFNYQGRLFVARGSNLLTATVNLKFEILNPAGTCVLYEETQNGINLATTNGVFAVKVGSQVGDTKRTGNDPGLSMVTVIANSGGLI